MTGPDPQRTRVLAVGIGTSDLGDKWELPGAGPAAVRFAEWALACGVPPERITLACTWARGESPPAGPLDRAPTIEPTADGLRAQLASLTDHQDDELLLVYWFGHGYVDRALRRTVLTANARLNDMVAFDVEDVLRYLISEHGSPATDQVLLIDSCANYVDGAGVADLVVAQALPPGATRGHRSRQLAYFAGQSGQIAAYDKVARKAAFSEAAFEWLEAHRSLDVDGKALVKHVETWFADRASSQTPVHRWCLLDGSERILESVRPGERQVLEATAGSELTDAQIVRLAAATLDLQASLGDAASDALRGLSGGRTLRTDAAALAWADDRLPDALDAVEDAAESEAELLAIEDLRKRHDRHARVAPVLKAWAGTELTILDVRRAYFRALGPDAGAPPDGLDDALERAADHGMHGPEAPLLRLVAEIEHVTSVPIPDDWYQLAPDSRLALRARAIPPAAPALLVVDLSGGTVPGHETWPSHATAYLRSPGSDWDREELHGPSADRKGVQAVVEQAVDWAYQRVGAHIRVGLLVSRSLIDEHPESWPVARNAWDQDGQPLWQRHPTVLHLADRRATPAFMTSWHAQADKARDLVVLGRAGIGWLDPGDPVRLRAMLQSATDVCCGLRFAPGVAKPFNQDALGLATIVGRPFVVWADDDHLDDRDTIESALKSMIDQDFYDVPGQLHAARACAVGMTHPLRVVWDDPGDLPPSPRPLPGLTGS